MSKSEWGVKRRCAKCEAPFYDMLRFPILCPKCGSSFRPDAPIARRPAAKPVKFRATRIPSKSALPTLDSAPEEVRPSPEDARDDGEDEVDRDEEEENEEEEIEADDDGIEESDEDATPGESQPHPRAR
jgi:uncharacterized protein (TIGR02300 family)